MLTHLSLLVYAIPILLCFMPILGMGHNNVLGATLSPSQRNAGLTASKYRECGAESLGRSAGDPYHLTSLPAVTVSSRRKVGEPYEGLVKRQNGPHFGKRQSRVFATNDLSESRLIVLAMRQALLIVTVAVNERRVFRNRGKNALLRSVRHAVG